MILNASHLPPLYGAHSTQSVYASTRPQSFAAQSGQILVLYWKVPFPNLAPPHLHRQLPGRIHDFLLAILPFTRDGSCMTVYPQARSASR